jgi:hypothetical protein
MLQTDMNRSKALFDTFFKRYYQGPLDSKEEQDSIAQELSETEASLLSHTGDEIQLLFTTPLDSMRILSYISTDPHYEAVHTELFKNLSYAKTQSIPVLLPEPYIATPFMIGMQDFKEAQGYESFIEEHPEEESQLTSHINDVSTSIPSCLIEYTKESVHSDPRSGFSIISFDSGCSTSKERYRLGFNPIDMDR